MSAGLVFGCNAILTDQLSEEGVQQLPEAEGISQTERKRRLDQIDRDIKGLEDKIRLKMGRLGTLRLRRRQ